ncbi:hypothetical protein RHSIM_Rhsim01G0078200 [Rhododendron simsii]|uniref:Protein kinase domain-containing protein n=1 Tax=Rhododendron simsii TaxID=118357 RepID=A0A834HEW5_RHOSS|nr:hypothetical protein RHSIM_Rhsim01G0078200 [Rhododendron simsii]
MKLFMEDKKGKAIAASLILAFTTVIIVARVSLGRSNTFYLITGAFAAAILAVIVFFLLQNRLNSRRRLLETRMVSESLELRIEYSFMRKVAGVPTKFQHREIEVATDGFQTLVGKGASGSVFKGILNDGTLVAVKRITSEQRGEKEFRSEVAAIAGVHHVNLVRLLGYCCVPTGPRFLVYDFIPNGSLNNWIFPLKEEKENRLGGKIQHAGGCLEWSSRVRVAVDVAKALSYLHHDCRSKILHLDVKPENILLDENHRGFLSDFGVSKLMEKDASRVVTMTRGTKGYLAPEWILQQGISEKCDVFSYGIVLLEMVSGKRSCRMSKENGTDKSRGKFRYFPKIVSERLREGRVMEVVDKRVLERRGVDEREVKRLVCVGLWCIHEKPRMRPSMAQVVEMLEGRAAVAEPPETRMMMANLLSSYDEEMSSGQDSSENVASPVIDQGYDNDVHSSASHSIYLSNFSGR